MTTALLMQSTKAFLRFSTSLFWQVAAAKKNLSKKETAGLWAAQFFAKEFTHTLASFLKKLDQKLSCGA